MILTVTLNAALDITYSVDALIPHATHRVRSVHSRAGGKGINVARVLQKLGHDVVVTGFAGGLTGAEIHADIAAAALRDELITIRANSRRTVTVVSEGDATLFNEPGPQVLDNEWRGFCGRFAELAPAADVAVCSGSLPPGVPVAAYGILSRIARNSGARTVIDAEGPALRAAVGARPDVVKPNAAELTESVLAEGPFEAAATLRSLGAGAVVATFGADGLLALTPEGAWRARPPHRVAGNPTGAGDACVAALAAGMVTGIPWPERLRDAVALSAAAVLTNTAGDFDEDAYHCYRADVRLSSVDAAHDHERFSGL